MRYKIFAAALAVICAVFSVTLQAHADVITGWKMNSFYNEHKEDVIRTYVFCRTKETVSGYDAPGDAKPGGQIKKGKSVYIAAIWQDADGIWWGVTEIDWDKGLWLPLSKLYLYYDSYLFEEDYADRIYTGERVKFENGKHVYLYSYPCASSSYRTMFYTGSFIENEDYQPNTFFRDEDDRVWGMIRSDDGNSWVCVDDPYTELKGDGRYAREISALYLAGETEDGGSSPFRAGKTGFGSGTMGLSAGVIAAAAGALAAVWISAVVIVILIIRRKR